METCLIRTGAIGTAIAAIFFFTPALVVVLGIAGLSAWLGWLDQVLLPMLALCATILVAGILMRRRRRAAGRE